MPVTPPVTRPYNTYTARDIVLDAMIEIGMLAPGEQANLDPGVSQWALRKLNYLLDEWAAEDAFVYSVGFQVFNLIPNHQPHTIGPGSPATPTGTPGTPADFVVAQRPVRIESASLLLGVPGATVDTPINIEDDDWWAENPVKDLSATLPTHLYYSPDNLNGNCYFWPISAVAYPVRLELWSLLQQFSSISDPIDGPGGNAVMPPAYRAAMMLSLAEQLQTGAGKQADASLASRAMKARAAVFENNQMPPRIDTNDAGMPKEGRNDRQRYNFLTREPW